MIKGSLSTVAAFRSALRASTGVASNHLSGGAINAGVGSLGGRHGGAVRLARTVSTLMGSQPVPAAALASPAAPPASGAACYHAPASTVASTGAAATVAPYTLPFSLAAPSERRATVLEAVREQAASHSDAFYVVDLTEVARKYAQWRAEIPRARPYYAVKCNDDPRIVATLAKLGAGFDCASKGEMSMVTGLGVPASDIIFAHPAKQVSHIHYAKAKGIARMTFDNEDELRKIAREYPGAEVVLRILTDDSASVCRLGLKFGCPLSEVPHIMAVAKELGVTVRGISYHVGSGNGDANSFGVAVRDARIAFDLAREAGHAPTLLDIGGGFPGSELGAENPSSDRVVDADPASGNPYSKHPSFSSIAAVVRTALDAHFPEGCGVDIIAEPGRYFVKSSHVLAVNVIGKRVTVDEATGGKRINYYVNEGLYGSYNCILYDHVTCSPSLLLTTRTAEQVEAVADDSIARMDEDGNIVVEDEAVGSIHGADLAEVVTGMKTLAAAQQVAEQALMRKRSMVLGGDSDSSVGFSAGGGSGSGLSASAGPAIVAAAAKAFASAATGMRASAGSRGLSYHTLGSSARHASTSSGSPASAPSSADLLTAGGSHFPTTIWGNTCDSIDKITDEAVLPEMHIGDWLVFENMGAYTVAGSCKFNGFPISTKVYMHVDGTLEVQKEEVHA